MNTDEVAHRYSVGVSGVDGIEIASDRVVEVPAMSNKNFLVVASVEDGVVPKGSNKILFEIRAQGDEAVAVKEKRLSTCHEQQTDNDHRTLVSPPLAMGC